MRQPHVTSSASLPSREFDSSALAASVTSLGLRMRNWSFGDAPCFAIYNSGDSFIGTIKPTEEGLRGAATQKADREALLRLIKEYDDRRLSDTPTVSG